jgi:pantetheine-phosphate adenylyltransferase
MTSAVYAGSFDPITLGHLDLIIRAASSFETLVVAIGVNADKNPLFTTKERLRLIEECIYEKYGDANKIQVTWFDGLLVDFCNNIGATVVIRGLRAVTDFEAELGIAHANRTLAPEVDTFFLPTKPQFSFVSSSTVKALAKHPSPTSWATLPQYVPAPVLRALKEKFQPGPVM